MTIKRLSVPSLVEAALRREEAILSEDGALVFNTGKHTGRAAQDKYIVKDDVTENLVSWGKVNRPISEQVFNKLKARVLGFLECGETFESEGSVCAELGYATPVIVRSEYATHALFAKNIFRDAVTETNEKPLYIYAAPSVHADPILDGTRSETFIVLNLKTREVILGGTKYCGEIKKAAFTAMNFVLPLKGVLTMHAAANCDESENAAVFFGLSGTGKTTLSADPERYLIGDDEHAWGDDGIFNLEGGCYAKTIALSPKAEPEI